MASTGDHPWATRIVVEILYAPHSDRTVHAPVHALITLATAMTAVGNSQGAAPWTTIAETLARESIDNASSRAQIFRDLITPIAESGDFARATTLASSAETAAREIDSPSHRSVALIELSTVVAAAGDPERAAALATTAEITADEIGHPETRAQILMKLAGAVAAAGDSERAAAIVTTAEATAREIQNPASRGLALSEVATWMINSSGDTVLRQATELPQVRCVLAEVIGTTSWRSALPALAQLDPSILQAASDELLNRASAQPA